MADLWTAIDNRTLLVASTFVAVTFAPLIYLVSRAHRGYQGLVHWAWGFFFIALSVAFHSLRGLIPNFFPWILVNVTGWIGVLLFVKGTRLFLRLPWNGRPFYAIYGAGILLMLWFAFVYPSEGVRMVVTSLIQGGTLLSGWLSIAMNGPAPARQRLGYRFTATTFFVTGALMVLRMVVLAWRANGDTSLQANPANAVFFLLVVLTGIILFIFAFLLLTYERLVADLRDAHASLAAETAERLDAEKRLAEAWHMETVGRLAGGVAHFFNNRLCVVNGYAQMLLTGQSLPASARTALRNIEQAGQQMADMTDRLLAFSRARMLRNTLIDLPAWIADLTPQIQDVFPSNVEVRISRGLDRVPTFIEASELHRVILGMAANARDAMPSGGVFSIFLRQVHLQAGPFAKELDLTPGAYAVLSLTDTGCGMPEEVRSRVFEPFFSTRGLAESEGLGLGSSFGFVRQSGGTITVRSTPGEGCTFEIYLPLATSADVGGPARDNRTS